MGWGMFVCALAVSAGGQTQVAGAQRPVVAAPVVVGGGQVRDQQPPRPIVGTGTLAGVVVSDRGQAVKGARVSLGGSAIPKSVITDASGAFVFDKLPEGRYTINVGRSRYLSSSYGQKRPNRPGTAIQLADGEAKKNLTVTLFASSVISGAVYGDDGEPVQNAQVRAMRYTMQTGVKRLQAQNSVQTDDRGMFRIFGLAPGDYIVSAVGNSYEGAGFSGGITPEIAARIEEAVASARAAGRDSGFQITNGAVTLPGGQVIETASPVTFAQTFYPGATQPGNAMVISIGAGEERQGVDISLVKAQTATVSGTVLNSNPTAQGASITVSVQPVDDAALGTFGASSRVLPDGRFTLRNVPPGQYWVVARAQMQIRAEPSFAVAGAMVTSQTPLIGRTLVTVDGQPLTDVMVALDGGHSVQGRLVFEGGLPPDLSKTRFAIVAAPAPGVYPNMPYPAPVAVASDGTFKLTGLAAGKYTLRPQGGVSGFSLKSSIVNGADTLDFPFELGNEDITNAMVVMAAGQVPTELSGTLTDQNGMPAVDCTIVIFSAEQRYWTPASRRIVTVRPSTDGKYTYRGLPAGMYRIAAVNDLEPGSQYDPEFLKALVGASTSITLADGAKATQDLRIAVGG